MDILAEGPSFHLLTLFFFIVMQEGMLNKLQSHVEQEEGRWRQQLQIKEAELETIRDEKDQLQQSLEQLQRTEEVKI
jgi:Tfp pilus assembly protein PilO